MKKLATGCAVLALAATQASATAFQLREGSAIAIGSALAGRTANDSDVSLSIQNPAALRGVKTFAASGGAAGIFPSSDATARVTFAPGVTVTGSDNPNEAAFVPSFAVGYRLSPEFVVGFALKSPFGLALEYASDFPTAFDGLRSELVTISATPQIAWTPTPSFTVAAGVTLNYADAELTNFLAPPVSSLGRFGLQGDGIALGATFGILFEPAEGTKIGVNVQTGFDHTLEGEIVGPAFPGLGLGGQSAEADFSLPAIVSVGAIQAIDDDLRVMAEIEVTGWNAFDTIEFTNTDTGARLTDVQGYETSVMASLGVEYDYDERLTLRAGAAFDSTPTSIEFRSQRVPDSNRYWLAAGGSYKLTDTISIDAAYLYIHAEDATIRDSESVVPGSQVDVSNGRVHLVQVNVGYAF